MKTIDFEGREVEASNYGEVNECEIFTEAIEEAKALNKLITDEEKDRLYDAFINGDFDPDMPTQCIYGIITSNCNNARAYKLIAQCCKQIVVKIPIYDFLQLDEENYFDRSQTFFISALEQYIMLTTDEEDAIDSGDLHVNEIDRLIEIIEIVTGKEL